VLIHSATGGRGIAAIQLAKSFGAEIFGTVGNEAKKDYLVKTFDLNPDHIFSSRNSSFLQGILTVTQGRGVDVVLNSLSGDLLQDSFEACAEFGRFIEIGKKDILEHGRLDMTSFRRNISFIPCDLVGLYLSDKPAHHRLWRQLLHEAMDLIRSKVALPCTPLKVIDVANIEEAFRYFMQSSRMGKVSVSFQNQQSKLQVQPDRYESKFDSNKSYLMIGCLGGLGRSLAKWMMRRGARRFIFLGRTAMDKPSARALVEYLSNNGADVEVVRGDVKIYKDVEQCVQAAKTPIGGVIQGAMALHETIWTDMTAKQWHTVIQPKVQGSWHLHNALGKEGRDAQLDWFIMLSSTAGTIGAATESNYCAANAFLDAFARYRNNLGLPAAAIGYGRISEVGYLHDHPKIEAIMDRRGIQAINEDEMIQIMDLAIAYQHPSKWQPRYDHLANTHLLTGIDFSGLQWQRKHGFEGDIHVLSDPRASLFAAAFTRSAVVTANGVQSASTQGLPADVAKALTEGSGDTSLLDAVRNMVGKKISNLILLPFDKLRLDQKLGDFGMDSMLAAEFRTYIFHALEVDVPFMMLLENCTTVNSISAVVVENLKSRLVEEPSE
jgi:KR domain/Zinc-binding dehydrogenase/Phosphopantetheine attachment site